VDGNNYTKVEKALQRAKELEKCVVVHVKTKKGKGVEEAENSPEKFHSIAKNGSKGSTFHSEFADELIGLAESCDDVVAVTAAMGKGTGLSEFEDKHPERYFDVGIAEPHALTFSAGLAANGLKPFTAIYSTFLQRGYDNIIHDIALQNLPVKMFIDRAGLAVSDGATHHGIFDVAFLSHIPGVQIIAPADYEALRQSVAYAYSTDDPIAVRYPNATESSTIKEHFVYRNSNIGVRFDFDIANPPKNLFITYGAIAENVIDAQSIISSHGIDVGIILVETIKPYEAPVSFIKSAISTGTHIVYVEEGIRSGGAAVNTMDLLLSDNALDGVKYEIAAINDNFASPTQPCDLYDYVGLSSEKIAAYFIGEE
jgi:1-deoxy-D-xylulose-5-phosphate synthase